MRNEKSYLSKTAELVSDSKAENKLGVMYANTKAGKKVYISKVDAKNAEKEAEFVKSNVCGFCHDVYKFNANLFNDKVAEFYNNSADYYTYAENAKLTAEEIYNASKQISEASKNMVAGYTKEDEMELTK